MVTWKNTYTPMFIPAFFIITQIWKKPKCPPMDDRTKNCCLVTESCPTLLWQHGLPWVPWSPPGSSVYRISQARILEWVVTSFFRGCSQSRDQILVSCIGRWILYHSATREAQYFTTEKKNNNKTIKNVPSLPSTDFLLPNSLSRAPP